MAEEPFLRPIALLPVGLGTFAHQAWIIDIVAEHAGIGGDLGAGRAADQAMDGLVQPAPLEVPKRAVDGADRHHRLALAAMDQGAVHQIPQKLRRDRIASREQRRELPTDDRRDAWRHRPADSMDARIGIDADEHGLVAEVALIDLIAPVLIAEPNGPLAAELGIDVDRSKQSLLPKHTVGRDGAGDLAEADFGDFHRFLPDGEP